jgi:hypothetical protein
MSSSLNGTQQGRKRAAEGKKERSEDGRKKLMREKGDKERVEKWRVGR